MLNKGDIVVCVDNSCLGWEQKYLIQNNIYVIDSIDFEFVSVASVPSSFFHNRFKKLKYGDVLKMNNTGKRYSISYYGCYFSLENIETKEIVTFSNSAMPNLFTYCGAVATPGGECLKHPIDFTIHIKKEPKFKVGDVARCIKSIGYRVIKNSLVEVVEFKELHFKKVGTAISINDINSYKDDFELVSRAIDGVTYTKEEIYGKSPALSAYADVLRAGELLKHPIHTTIYIKKEKEMNKIIAEMYPKTKDAMLVDKWFGDIFYRNSDTFSKEYRNNIYTKLLIKGKEEDLLNAAKELEAEANKVK